MQRLAQDFYQLLLVSISAIASISIKSISNKIFVDIGRDLLMEFSMEAEKFYLFASEIIDFFFQLNGIQAVCFFLVV